MRIEWEAREGDLHHLSFGVRVELSDGTIADLGAIEANAFLPTDLERIVVIHAHESNAFPTELRVIDLEGQEMQAESVMGFGDPVLSGHGRFLAFRSRAGVRTLDLASFVSRTYPALDLYAVDDAGRLVGFSHAQRELQYWPGPGEALRVPFTEAPRALSFVSGSEGVLALTSQALIEFSWERGLRQTLYEAEEGVELRDLRVDRRGIHLGRRHVTGNSTRGSALTLAATGPSWIASSSMRVMTPTDLLISAPVGALPWPLAPSAAYPVGNSYGEYQNYGGSPYLHPGIDVLGADGHPVHAVRGGVVKAILTTSGEYHWRIAIGNTGGSGSTVGYLYAHIDQPTIAVNVGDVVVTGQYLGDLVPWPVTGFTHTHFARVKDSGVTWNGDWLCTDNSHPDHYPQTDTSAPVFENALGGDLFAFCLNESSVYQNPNAISGAVDIIAHVSDDINTSAWPCTVQELRYTIFPIGSPQTPIVDDKLAVRFDMELDTYRGGATDSFLVDLFYKQDNTCPTEGDYGDREFFHVITNSNGDEVYNAADVNEAWDTTTLSDGDYVIEVTAIDATGNSTTASMVVRTQNGNP